ncbi:DUF3899 domain-containing protein [Sutcliffiella deserti]|uniref:DUF3899 domain-containing protein n=1 Tax=Sutcliffiella deserti TaxID=2875501 RepID=UPI001CC1797B|nr:DUF3899 domain-containing protein [Sutcliffiella deserti]
MKKLTKHSLIYFVILLFLSIIVGVIYYNNFSLLVFINTSFFVSGTLLSFSLLILVTQNGFFDGITYGFRKVFASRQADKELEQDIRNEMRDPSELLDPIHVSPMIIGSSLLFLCMLFSLLVYYNS